MPRIETGLERRGPRSVRGRLELALLAALAAFPSSFAGAFTHEVLGHGLVGVLLGHSFYAFYASPVGTSEAYVDLGKAADWEKGLVNAGGIASDILVGALLLALSGKMKRFAPKLLLFFWAADSLVGGSSYLAISSVSSFLSGSQSGDPYWISRFFRVPLLALSFIGFAAYVPSIYVLFKKLARTLADRLDCPNREEALASVSAIWISGLVPIQAISAALEGELGSKLLLLLFNSASIIIVGHLAPIETKVEAAGPPPLERRQVAAISLAAVVAAAAWLGIFGPTSKTAHGVVLEEYPSYMNVRATILENLTAEVRLDFRPGPFENAWPNLKGTAPRWDRYVEEALLIAGAMFGSNGSQLVNRSTGDGSFWHSGSWHVGGARSVLLRIPKVRAEEAEGGVLALTLPDPWKPGGFVDSLNVTLIGLRLMSSAPEATFAYFGETEFVFWLNNSTDTSPDEYRLVVAKKC
ncbi:MAG: hypothetical protein QXF24_00130 [Thermoproteota archaeon]